MDCQSGFDGGLAQTFTLEVYDSLTQDLLGNLTSATPWFSVTGLRPGLSLQLVVFAHNAKGRSEVVLLAACTLKPELRIDGFPLQLGE